MGKYYRSVNSEYDRSGFQPAVRVLLRVLSDSHSSYRFGNWLYRESFITCIPSQLFIENLPDEIGYVAIRAIATRSPEEEKQNYLDEIKNTLKEGRDRGVTAWVLDLTENLGGSFPIMLASVGPLLGNDIHGYFLDPNDGPILWGYEDGDAYIGDRSNVFAAVSEPAEVINPELKIAVIIDSETASAGEATAISFIGRANTRIFGQRSCGLSTGNTAFELSNGAIFNLTTAIMADREQNSFGEKVSPDELLNNSMDLNARVLEWLAE
ncbi:MAG: S41 family peptidase [Cytophagales bacterium]|nr:S41 family peptidase [Cytophagales bacterium]